MYQHPGSKDSGSGLMVRIPARFTREMTSRKSSCMSAAPSADGVVVRGFDAEVRHQHRMDDERGLIGQSLQPVRPRAGLVDELAANALMIPVDDPVAAARVTAQSGRALFLQQ